METKAKYSKDVLEEELTRRIQELESMDPGSDEASNQLQYVEVLHKLKMAEEEIEETRRANEAKEKADRIKERNDRILGIAGLGVTLFTFAVGMANRNRLYKMGLEFEENGTLTSKTFGEVFREALHLKN